MEKHTQDKSSVDNKDVIGRKPEQDEKGTGSFNENHSEEIHSADKNDNIQSKNIDKEDMDKANIKTGLNEDKSTVSETSSPSKSISVKTEK